MLYMRKLAILSTLVLLIACGSGGYSSDNEESDYIGNPYSEDTGHYSGYEWAEQTGGSCNGNSQSFNEGCEEYYRQMGR